MNTAVFCLPMSSMLKSLYESISLNCSREANSLIFCLNTDKILPFVSFGAFIVLDANTYGLESSPFKRKYSFVSYNDYPKQYDCVAKIKKWMDKGEVLRFIVTGTEINFQVRITDFEYSEQDGTRDVYFTINLKEYRKIKISSTTPKKKKTDNKDRTDTKETDNKPKQKTYTVKSGDTLYDIAKKYYGKGSDYKKIIEKNKSKYPSLAKSTTLKKGWVLTI